MGLFGSFAVMNEIMLLKIKLSSLHQLVFGWKTAGSKTQLVFHLGDQELCGHHGGRVRSMCPSEPGHT